MITISDNLHDLILSCTNSELICNYFFNKCLNEDDKYFLKKRLLTDKRLIIYDLDKLHESLTKKWDSKNYYEYLNLLPKLYLYRDISDEYEFNER